MNKILVEVSIGELLDKISILEIKQEKIKDAEKLKYIHDEYKVLKEQLSINVKSDDKLNELFKIGDIIYVKYLNNNKYSLKQIPKANGGIVVMDPYTGRVLAM